MFAALVIVLGSSYPFTKVGLRGFDPLTMTLFRLVIGFGFLAAWMSARGVMLPSRRDLRPLFALGLVNTAGAFLLLTWGQEYVAASVAAILVAVGPIFATLGAAAALPDEQVTRRTLAGVAVGFCGVAVLFADGIGGGEGAHPGGAADAIAGAVAIIAGAALIAFVSIVVRRRFGYLQPAQIALPLVSTGMVTVTLAIGVLLAIHSGSLRFHPSVTTALLATSSLGLLNAGVGNLLYYGCLHRLGVTGTSLAGYVAPAVGVLLTVVIVHERPGLAELGGLVLIVSSLALVNPGRLRSGPDRPDAMPELP